MLFFWKLHKADISEVRRLVGLLRQKAIDLNWLPVGDVVHLTDQECSDGERLPGHFLLIAAGDTVLAPTKSSFSRPPLLATSHARSAWQLTPATWKAAVR